MKNKISLVIFLLFILLLGFTLFNKTDKNNLKSESNQKETLTNSKSFTDLLKEKENQRCSFNTSLTKGSTKGTFYIATEAARGDFAVSAKDGSKIETTIIKIGESYYIFGSNFRTGLKVKLSDKELSSNNKISQYFDPNQKIEYTCRDWKVDNSILKVPTNIKFTDITSLIK